MKVIHSAQIVNLTGGSYAQVAELSNGTEIKLDSAWTRRYRPAVGGSLEVLENCEMRYRAGAPIAPEPVYKEEAPSTVGEEPSLVDEESDEPKKPAPKKRK